MLSKLKQFVNPVRNLSKIMKNLLSRFSNGVKTHREEIILIIGVILISLLSFAAGYITARLQEKEPIRFEEESSLEFSSTVKFPVDLSKSFRGNMGINLGG